MGNISIGSCTPRINPQDMTIPRPVKLNAHKLTYGGVAYFSWAPSIVGKEINIAWDFMDADEFAALDVLYQNDQPIVFDPQDGSNKTYNAEITLFDGKYMRGLDTSNQSIRKEVKMTLLILSQV